MQLVAGLTDELNLEQNRTYVQDSRRPPITNASMALYQMNVLKSPYNEDLNHDVLSLLEMIILDMIKMERKGETIDRQLVRACCYMLEGLYESISEEETTKLYLTSFEPKFLESSRDFYREEGKQLLAEADASTFCSHARRRLKEEEERCQQTISKLSEQKIISVVETELIQAHMAEVIELEGTGVKNMIDNDRIRDLANVFDLVVRVDPRRVPLKNAIQKRVVDLGNEINKTTNAAATEKIVKPTSKDDKADGEKSAPDKSMNQQTAAAISWVEEVLKLKAKFDAIWETAFKRDNVLEKALEVSFQDFINANNRSSEHLSLFLDEYLKKGGKGKSADEVDAIIDSGITLLQYLGDKDLFETYYKKHMAKRLLLKKSISRDIERQILSKMKVKLGNQFTQKMDGLIRDMELSDTLNTQYKDYVNKLGDIDPRRVDVEASILTTNVWPFDGLLKPTDDEAARRECKYPEVIERARSRYTKFYLDKHTGRKLTWLPNMGTADVRATFKGSSGKSRRYEVNISTFGMVILMLFNDLAPGASLTFEEIEAETNISQQDLKRNLQSLSLSPKWRMLKKDPMSKDVKPTDKFSFNEDFTSQFLKIKVSAVSQSSKTENSDERKETQKRADEERGHSIEAAIVRIMKARKTLTHQQLMTETLTQLSSRFQPDVNMVKKKIEALIDREYLERGGDDSNSYKYLA